MVWSANRDPVIWKRCASEIIVRYEISGGRAARAGTQVPAWTVYGDGFVVWTEDTEESLPGFAGSVWTGWMEPAAIQGLLTMALECGFFELEDSYRPNGATHNPAGLFEGEPVDPIPMSLDVEAETLSISLVNNSHRVRVSPSGWLGAPAAFRKIRETIHSLEPTESRRYVPQAYRLIVARMEGETAGDFPSLARSLSGIDLAAGLVAPLNLGRAEGEAMAVILEEHGAIVAQDGKEYRLHLLAVRPRE